MTTMTKTKTDDVADEAAESTTKSSEAASSTGTTRRKPKAEPTQPKGASTMGKLRGLTSRLTPQGSGYLVPTVAWSSLIRVVTVVGYYLMVTVSVFSVIPFIGAWIHQQGLGGRGPVSTDMLIAMWIMPFAFLVLMLAVGEMAVMRKMWRAGSRKIAQIKAHRGEQTSTEVTAPAHQDQPRAKASTIGTITRTTKVNRNKKKR